MAYREKTAWLTLVCMLVAYAVYFAGVGIRSMHQPFTLFDILWWFGGVASVQAVAVIVGSIVLARFSRGEERAPADERDRAIARRGANVSYYILMVGIILVGVVMPFGDPPARTVNSALFMLVLAETVRLVIIVRSYRRGWHG